MTERRPVFNRKPAAEYTDEELVAEIAKLRGFMSVLYEIAGMRGTDLAELEGERAARGKADD